jgi:hypothetical protein
MRLQARLDVPARHRGCIALRQVGGAEGNVAAMATFMESGIEWVACDNPHLNKFTAHILAAVAVKQVSKADAVAELSRRIEQRAAAGKHPMVFVVAARDELVAA